VIWRHFFPPEIRPTCTDFRLENHTAPWRSLIVHAVMNARAHLTIGCRAEQYAILRDVGKYLLRTQVCAAAKNSQKNDGLYFEYERVDPEAAKELPIEQGGCCGCMRQIDQIPKE